MNFDHLLASTAENLSSTSEILESDVPGRVGTARVGKGRFCLQGIYRSRSLSVGNKSSPPSPKKALPNIV